MLYNDGNIEIKEYINMLKKIIYLGILCFTVLSIFACSAENVELNYQNGSNSNVIELADETNIPDRKIIYTVNISFDVPDLDESSEFLSSIMESDEWFDEEVITASLSSYVIRIRTDHLDSFINSLKDEYDLRSYRKVGDDVSLEYQDVSNQILALNAQLDRLLELYDQASLTDMITINQQISNIEVQIQSLEGSINQFDSLVDYSVVNLDFYQGYVSTQSPFFNRLGNAFGNGFDALFTFFDGLLIGLATAFPFLVLLGSGAYLYVVVHKKRRFKKSDLESELQNDSKKE